MTYFTDKAFSASWLERSKGLSEMLVKKDEVEESVPHLPSKSRKNTEPAFNDNYRYLFRNVGGCNKQTQLAQPGQAQAEISVQ